jgi:hypothetical protein
LQEGDCCPWEKERVCFGSAGLKFHACRRELAASGEKEKVIFGSAGLKLNVWRKELAIPVRRRKSSLVVQD